MPQLLSLVVPCYNEEATIEIFYNEILKYEKQIDADIEFCFIDDGSRDKTLSILRQLHAKDERVHYISFSRNFGKEAGLYAGLSMAKGDYVATMDVDLQDPPSLLPKMWRMLHTEGEEIDCIATRRDTRTGEPVLRSFFAKLFYKFINAISKTNIVDGARDFRMMSRQMVDAVVADREYNRFSKGIFSWVGFHTVWLSYDNIERSAGETKWSFWNLFRYSIEGILAYTVVPLYAASVLGIIMCVLSFLALAFIFIRSCIWGDAVAGWPSLVCIITFLGGIMMLSLGIIGLYLSKIYLETKKRQISLVREQK